jgi:putative phosphoribosyl transferase
MQIQTFTPIFEDRTSAGRLLAEKLHAYHRHRAAIVLGLPRGGVPVAFEVARRLELALDVLVVRKLGVPWQPELAFGALGAGGVRVLDPEIVQGMGISEEELEEVVARELAELERRERAFRGERPTLDLKQRTVILVDDGIATGATMRAATKAARLLGASRIIVAAAVAAVETYEELRTEADEVVCLAVPDPFYSVGSWYRSFPQLEDQAVRDLLARSAAAAGHD